MHGSPALVAETSTYGISPRFNLLIALHSKKNNWQQSSRNCDQIQINQLRYVGLEREILARRMACEKQQYMTVQLKGLKCIVTNTTIAVYPVTSRRPVTAPTDEAHDGKSLSPRPFGGREVTGRTGVPDWGTTRPAPN